MGPHRRKVRGHQAFKTGNQKETNNKKLTRWTVERELIVSFFVLFFFFLFVRLKVFEQSAASSAGAAQEDAANGEARAGLFRRHVLILGFALQGHKLMVVCTTSCSSVLREMGMTPIFTKVHSQSKLEGEQKTNKQK